MTIVEWSKRTLRLAPTGTEPGAADRPLFDMSPQQLGTLGSTNGVPWRLPEVAPSL
jgi:hypothetical protein